MMKGAARSHARCSPMAAISSLRCAAEALSLKRESPATKCRGPRLEGDQGRHPEAAIALQRRYASCSRTSTLMS